MKVKHLAQRPGPRITLSGRILGWGPGSRCASHPSLWQKRALPSLGLPQETPLAKPPTTLGLSFSVFEMEGKGLEPLTKGA